MKLASFSILTALAVLYAGLTFAETALYHSWEHAVDGQKDIQAKVAYYQRLNVFIQQVLRRTAIDSQHDPALVQLLKKYKITVVVSGSEPANAASGVLPTQIQIPPVPQTSTPSHP